MPRRALPRAAVAALVCALVALGAGGPAPSADASAPAPVAACATFPETGKTVCDRFLEYWQQNGGLAQQGLPLTDPFVEVNPTDGKPYLTQYFERARFELHPENARPYDVLLGLLGDEQLRAKYPGGTVPAGIAGNPLGAECVAFAETGKTVCGIFLDYWRAHGGLAQQGFPLTDIFLENNPTNSQQYPTQYFQRARFEYHREFENTPYAVLLGLLGREQLLARYPNGVPSGPAPSAAPTSTPTRTPITMPPTPTRTPTRAPQANCHPAYPTVCIPPPPPDLDCGQIPHRNFTVLAPDPHRFDADNDGIGCES